MLKNKIWIVALLIALAIGFIGCTDAAKDWEAPTEQLDDNAIQILPKETYVGIDLNDAKFNFAVGDKIVVTGKALATNTIHISDNHQSWSPIGTAGSQKCAPDEEYEISATLTKANVDSIKAVSPPAVRVYGNTANATYIIYNIVVTRGTEEIFNYYEQILKTLTPGTTDINKIFDTEGIGDNPLQETEDKAKHWTSQAANKGTAGVFTILGPGYGGTAAEPVPEYKGNPDIEGKDKVKFEEGLETTTDRLDDVVVDYDPLITGVNVKIDSNGVASFDGVGGRVDYKFPAAYITGSGKKATSNPIDLLNDFDYVEIEYTITGEDGGTAASPILKTRFQQFESPTSGNDEKGYAEKIEKWNGTAWSDNGGNWVNGGTAGANSGKYKIQTWGAGGKAGFSIRINIDAATYTKFKLKINSVKFTTGERFTVKYASPQTNYAGTSQEVLTGNGPRLPSLSLLGWKFLGWYPTFNSTTQNTGTTGTAATTGAGTKVTTSTSITEDKTFFAAWISLIPPPKADNSPSLTGNLYTNSTWADEGVASKITFNSKQWDLFYNGMPGQSSQDLGPWTIEDEDENDVTIPSQTASVVVFKYTLDSDFSNYDKVKFTYDLVMLTPNKNAVVGLTDGSPWSGGTEQPKFEEGEGKTVTYDVPASGVIAYRPWYYYGTGLGTYLFRLTKVELFN